MYVKTGTGRFVYGELEPRDQGQSIGRAVSGDTGPEFAVEIIREYGANELVGKLYRRGSSGDYLPVDPGALENRTRRFPRDSQQFQMAGSGSWKVLHLRMESDEAGPYVAIALRYEG